VKPDEARYLIWLVPTKVFADLLLSLVTLRLTERGARNANCTAGTVRANWSEASSLLAAELKYVVSLTALRWTQVKTRLATIHVAVLVAMENLFIGLLPGHRYSEHVGGFRGRLPHLHVYLCCLEG
jgi:hypothetical protein